MSPLASLLFLMAKSSRAPARGSQGCLETHLQRWLVEHQQGPALNPSEGHKRRIRELTIGPMTA